MNTIATIVGLTQDGTTVTGELKTAFLQRGMPLLIVTATYTEKKSSGQDVQVRVLIDERPMDETKKMAGNIARYSGDDAVAIQMRAMGTTKDYAIPPYRYSHQYRKSKLDIRDRAMDWAKAQLPPVMLQFLDDPAVIEAHHDWIRKRIADTWEQHEALANQATQMEKYLDLFQKGSE